MEKKVIFDYINHYKGALYSLLIFGFLGIATVNLHFNFSVPKATKIRDIADFSIELKEQTKLSIDKTSLSLASTFSAAVPRTSSSSATTSGLSATISDSGLFTISNPISVSNPAVDAGRGVKRYGEKFLYGHSTLAFSPLKQLYVGDRFVVEMDGKIETYVVSRREVMSKSTLNSNSALRKSIYSAKYMGKSYDLSLMTCGNGANDDSNYRLILFATKL